LLVVGGDVGRASWFRDAHYTSIEDPKLSSELGANATREEERDRDEHTTRLILIQSSADAEVVLKMRLWTEEEEREVKLPRRPSVEPWSEVGAVPSTVRV
jgi:hypothetical protein